MLTGRPASAGMPGVPKYDAFGREIGEDTLAGLGGEPRPSAEPADEGWHDTTVAPEPRDAPEAPEADRPVIAPRRPASRRSAPRIPQPPRQRRRPRGLGCLVGLVFLAIVFGGPVFAIVGFMDDARDVFDDVTEQIDGIDTPIRGPRRRRAARRHHRPLDDRAGELRARARPARRPGTMEVTRSTSRPTGSRPTSSRAGASARGRCYERRQRDARRAAGARTPPSDPRSPTSTPARRRGSSAPSPSASRVSRARSTTSSAARTSSSGQRAALDRVLRERDLRRRGTRAGASSADQRATVNVQPRARARRDAPSPRARPAPSRRRHVEQLHPAGRQACAPPAARTRPSRPRRPRAAARQLRRARRDLNATRSAAPGGMRPPGSGLRTIGAHLTCPPRSCRASARRCPGTARTSRWAASSSRRS